MISFSCFLQLNLSDLKDLKVSRVLALAELVLRGNDDLVLASGDGGSNGRVLVGKDLAADPAEGAVGGLAGLGVNVLGATKLAGNGTILGVDESNLLARGSLEETDG